MKLTINNVKVNISYDTETLYKKAQQILFVERKNINEIKILKRSIDARDKNNIFYLLKLYVDLKSNQYKKGKDILPYEEMNTIYPFIEKKKKIVVVGSGPAGLFSALTLAKANLKPIVIERGYDVDTRSKNLEEFIKSGKLNIHSNTLFGEGGAGTFSDGKLQTNTHSDLIDEVLKSFYEAGAPEEILYDAKPHIGTDILVNVVKNIRKKIISLGGTFLFAHQLMDIDFSNKQIKVQTEKELKAFDVDYLILAIGHSARDTVLMLYNKGLHLEQKPFAVGLRVEHPQKLINESQYGKFANDLPNADYKLVAHVSDERSVYSFCMCPGGRIINASSEENMLAVNGMSYHARDLENANSAILVNVNKEDFKSTHPLAGIEFQREYERKTFLISNSYLAPVQRLADFIENKKTTMLGEVKPSYQPGYVLANLNDCLPGFISKAIKEAFPMFNRKIKGFMLDDAILTGVETRSSSPVRIVRNELMQSSCNWIYPIGEGAGYAGGITSAAVDGIKAARLIIKEEE